MKAQNPELVREWVAQLRDPNTKQARSVLRDQSGAVCALGALCNAAETLGLGEWVQYGSRWLFEVNGDEGYTNYPPDALMVQVTTTANDGVPLQYQGRERFVYSLNDRDRLPLPVIADLIEGQYL